MFSSMRSEWEDWDEKFKDLRASLDDLDLSVLDNLEMDFSKLDELIEDIDLPELDDLDALDLEDLDELDDFDDLDDIDF